MSKLQYSRLSGLLSGLSYNYTYNSLGQIASIARGNNAADTYTYDSMGQLTSAWLPEEGLNYTNTYTYGNNSWKDLLTKFNSQAIAYEGQTYSPSTGGISAPQSVAIPLATSTVPAGPWIGQRGEPGGGFLMWDLVITLCHIAQRDFSLWAIWS